MEIALRRFIALGALAICFAHLAFAADSGFSAFEQPVLNIEFSGYDISAWEKATKKSFTKTCAGFAKNFVNNQGLWGTGSFAEAQCTRSLVSKARRSPADKSVWPTHPHVWNLRIRERSDELIFVLSPRNLKGVKPIVIALTDIHPLDLMEDGRLSSLLALYFSVSQPFRSVVLPDQLKLGAEVGGPNRGVEGLDPPKELKIFSLSYVNKFWHHKTIGKAQLKSNGKTGTKYVVSELLEPQKDAVYFMQQSDSRSEVIAELRDIIEGSQFSFLNALFKLKNAAYVGLRVGYPVQSGPNPLAKAFMYGLFGEFRAGFLSGLRMNYDLIPAAELEDENGLQVFEWSRFQLGYSFGRPLELPVLNWIDVTPRVGVTTLRVDFTPSANSNSSPYSFNQSRAPTVGIEVGFERRNPMFLMRNWYFASYSLGILPLDRKYNTTASRAGLDIYKTVTEFRNVSLSLMGFTSLDSTTIKNNVVDDAAEVVQVKQVTYNIWYAGGGFNLVW